MTPWAYIVVPTLAALLADFARMSILATADKAGGVIVSNVGKAIAPDVGWLAGSKVGAWDNSIAVVTKADGSIPPMQAPWGRLYKRGRVATDGNFAEYEKLLLRDDGTLFTWQGKELGRYSVEAVSLDGGQVSFDFSPVVGASASMIRSQKRARYRGRD